MQQVQDALIDSGPNNASPFLSWLIVQANRRKDARLERNKFFLESLIAVLHQFSFVKKVQKTRVIDDFLASKHNN